MTKCLSREKTNFEKLNGKRCPQCKKGKLEIDREFQAIS
jgi:Zn finger protein HypA/HybF involved in hydrogenase expression